MKNAFQGSSSWRPPLRRGDLLAGALVAMMLHGCLGAEFGRALGRALALMMEPMLASFAPWSPDGSRLLVARLGDPDALRILHLDGTPPESIPGKFLAPAWSPDGTRILAVAFPDPSRPGGYDLVVMSADGSDRRSLLTDFESPPLLAAWSPDGTWIACSPLSTGVIELVRPDGSERRSLGPGLWPVWSPDSTRVASTLPASGRASPGPWVQVQRVDGSGTTRLAAGRLPSWSPDGARLVFWSTSVVNGEARESLSIVDANGADPWILCAGLLPSWSPSGERILAQDPEEGLFTIAPDGSDWRVLARDARFARWSPDGRWIAFQTTTDVRVIGVDGTGERSLGSLDVPESPAPALP